MNAKRLLSGILDSDWSFMTLQGMLLPNSKYDNVGMVIGTKKKKKHDTVSRSEMRKCYLKRLKELKNCDVLLYCKILDFLTLNVIFYLYKYSKT